MKNKNLIKNRRENIKKKVLKICSKIPISNKTLGIWIRSYHYTLPAYIFFSISFAPKWIVKMSYLLLFLIISLFFYFRACWLSIIEKELCEDDANIADWLLELCNYKINKKNRYKITYLYFSFYLTSIFIITYLRFRK